MKNQHSLSELKKLQRNRLSDMGFKHPASTKNNSREDAQGHLYNKIIEYRQQVEPKYNFA